MPKALLNTPQTIEVLTELSGIFGPERFITRIWNCLDWNGREAIRREFSGHAEFETFDLTESQKMEEGGGEP